MRCVTSVEGDHTGPPRIAVFRRRVCKVVRARVPNDDSALPRGKATLYDPRMTPHSGSSSSTYTPRPPRPKGAERTTPWVARARHYTRIELARKRDCPTRPGRCSRDRPSSYHSVRPLLHGVVFAGRKRETPLRVGTNTGRSAPSSMAKPGAIGGPPADFRSAGQGQDAGRHLCSCVGFTAPLTVAQLRMATPRGSGRRAPRDVEPPPNGSYT